MPVALKRFMRFVWIALFILLFCGTDLSLAQSVADNAYREVYTQPPRFQIFTAPHPYGGLLMVDTKTGESWQRVIINTPKGISIRWMKLTKDEPFKKDETILWR